MEDGFLNSYFCFYNLERKSALFAAEATKDSVEISTLCRALAPGVYNYPILEF